MPETAGMWQPTQPVEGLTGQTVRGASSGSVRNRDQ